MSDDVPFLPMRRDWLRVEVHPRFDGDGWDVLLRIDGTYADRELAEHVSSYFAEWVGGEAGGPVGVVGTDRGGPA